MCCQRCGATTASCTFRWRFRRAPIAGVDQAGLGRRRRQRPGRQPLDARRAGLRHHARAVREEVGAGGHPSRGRAAVARARPATGSPARVSSWCAAVLRRAEGRSMNTVTGSSDRAQWASSDVCARADRGREGSRAPGIAGPASRIPSPGRDCARHRALALFPLLGPLHRSAADLSRQLSARRAGADLPAVSGAEREPRGRVARARLGCSSAPPSSRCRGRSSISAASSIAPRTRCRSTWCSAA